jgi:hypothetical protein
MSKLFSLYLQRQFRINSAINNFELKTIPTIRTTSAGIKWETEKAKNRSIAASLYVLHPSKKLVASVLSSNEINCYDIES